MGQTREAITPTLAERLCWQAPQRDAVRVARRLYRKGMVDGVYRLDEGALLDDFFHFLRELGVLDVMEGVQGAALQREMVPVVQYLFAGHHQPLRVWILCLYLMGLNLSNYQIAQELDLNKDDVQQMTCQLRQGIVTKKPIPTLTAEVGWDEVYVVAGHKGKPEAVVKKDGTDGDGFDEVHVNTTEGFWSLLRSWRRPHRGISQKNLPWYLGVFDFVHNVRRRGQALLGALLELPLT